jgi:prepilin-type N-terminal cleavage/methylation domain-containing protein/prepilin-type processing-associated H-X9-DG protein
MPASRRKKAEAFTLVELLVVITIIAILAALFLTVISGRKAAAQRSVCLSNQKQLVTALIMYANGDSKQSFGGTEKRRDLYPYVDENWLRIDENLPIKIFFCPATRNGEEAEQPSRMPPGQDNPQHFSWDLAYPASWAEDKTGYSYDALLWFADMEDYWNGNSDWRHNSRYIEKTLSSIQSYAHANEAFGMKGQRFGPSRIWLLTDNDARGHDHKFWPEAVNNHGTAGANTAFTDGHVEWIPRQEYVYKYEASQDNNRTRATPRPSL